MAVFQNGPLGPLVVCRVALDSNSVIETAPIPLPLMEGKSATVESSTREFFLMVQIRTSCFLLRLFQFIHDFSIFAKQDIKYQPITEKMS